MFFPVRNINVLFDGIQCKRMPTETVVRGRVVFENGKVDDSAKGYGEVVAHKVK